MTPQRISIVLPTYNGAKYLGQAVESCLNQTYTDIELIIVDDASTDAVPSVISSFKDQRIRVIRHPANRGLPAALNTGFKNSAGEYLTWTSDDNYYAPEALKTMAEYLDNYPDTGFVYANYYKLVENAGKPVLIDLPGPKYLSFKNCVGACFLYRRKVYETVGDYNPEAKLVEDYEYWLRVREKFKMKKLGSCLYYYRSHENTLSFGSNAKLIEEKTELVRNRYIPRSLRYYFQAEKAKKALDYSGAFRLLLISLALDPFNAASAKLLVMVLLGDAIVNGFRALKNRITGTVK